jgi:hypothetical protein
MIEVLCKSKFNSQYSFTQFESLEGNRTVWDDFLPANHNLKSQNLFFYQNCCTTQNLYVTIKKNDQLIGLVYIQKLLITAKDINFSLLSLPSIRCGLKTILTLKKDLSFLVIGNLYKNGFEGSYIKHEDEQHKLYEDLLSYLTSKNEVTGVVIKECDQKLNLRLKKENTFEQFSDDNTMQLSLNSKWNNLDDYANELSKKYKKRLIKITDSAKTLICKDLSNSELYDLQDQMFELYLQVYNKQNIKLGKLKSNYFVEMQKHLKENFQVVGIFKADQLIAFYSQVNNTNTQAEIHYIGINYAFNEQYNLYFNVLFWGLEKAIVQKKKIVDFGRTAYTAKASLGAEPVSMTNFVYFSKGFLRWNLSWLLKAFYNKNELKLNTRSPFLVSKTL